MRTVFMSSPFLRWGRRSSSRTQRLGSPRTVSGDTRTARRGGADLDLGGRDRCHESLARAGPRGASVYNRAILRYCCLPSRSRVRHRGTECRRAGTIHSAICPSDLNCVVVPCRLDERRLDERRRSLRMESTPGNVYAGRSLRGGRDIVKRHELPNDEAPRTGASWSGFEPVLADGRAGRSSGSLNSPGSHSTASGLAALSLPRLRDSLLRSTAVSEGSLAPSSSRRSSSGLCKLAMAGHVKKPSAR